MKCVYVKVTLPDVDMALAMGFGHTDVYGVEWEMLNEAQLEELNFALSCVPPNFRNEVQTKLLNMVRDAYQEATQTK